MKKMVLLTLLLVTASLLVSAESITKIAIVQEDTGNPATMTILTNPDFSAGMTMNVLVQISNLKTKWNEGFLTYTYTYYTDRDQKIWTSQKQTVKKNVNSAAWNYSEVLRIKLPVTITKGSYKIGFDVTDYHSDVLYKGSAVFSIDMKADQKPKQETLQPEPLVKQEPKIPQPSEEPKTEPKQPSVFPMSMNFKGFKVEVTGCYRELDEIRVNFQVTNNTELATRFDVSRHASAIYDASGNKYTRTSVFFFGEEGGMATVTGGKVPSEITIKGTITFYQIPKSVKNVKLFELEGGVAGDFKVLPFKNLPIAEN
jgi:hypothetical protein